MEGLTGRVSHRAAFCIMQGEVCAEAAYGEHGSQELSVEKL